MRLRFYFVALVVIAACSEIVGGGVTEVELRTDLSAYQISAAGTITLINGSASGITYDEMCSVYERLHNGVWEPAGQLDNICRSELRSLGPNQAYERPFVVTGDRFVVGGEYRFMYRVNGESVYSNVFAVLE